MAKHFGLSYHFEHKYKTSKANKPTTILQWRQRYSKVMIEKLQRVD